MPPRAALIEGWQYFIVHAPRQTGKTTTLAALAAQLTADGRHVALRLSCERAEAWGDGHRGGGARRARRDPRGGNGATAAVGVSAA